MSEKVFMDSSAWVALVNKADQYHAKAFEFYQHLLANHFVLISSNFILDETYTLIQRRMGNKYAVEFGEKLRIKNSLQIITIDQKIEKEAWNLFKKFKDQAFSYTDCTSFALMSIKKLKKVFSFDKDFYIAGFDRQPSYY